jgi:uncharacterized membrane protein YbhN (UPF0104 family)
VPTPIQATSFFNSLGKFFSGLASVKPLALLLALLLFLGYLTIRSRAYLNIIRAAFPQAAIRFRDIWGAYVIGFGFNAVLPARGGNVVKVFLVHRSVPGSNYPAVVSSFICDFIFDITVAIPVLIYAFSQGVFPKPPDFASLDAVDLAWLASNPRRTLFLMTLLAVGLLSLFAFLSVRVKAFWEKVRQGFAVLGDRRRYLVNVWLVQFAGWWLQFASFWFMLDAFGVGAQADRVLLVLGCQAVSSMVPLSPGGAGVFQALVAKVFAGTASETTVAAFSVGMEISIAAFTFAVSFASLVWLFGFRSIGEVRRAGHAHREAAKQQGG